MGLWPILTAMTALAVALLILPLLARSGRRVARRDYDLEVYKAQLRELGSARTEAIRALLVDEAGIDVARVQVLDPVAVEPSGDRWVRCRLDVAAGS